MCKERINVNRPTDTSSSRPKKTVEAQPTPASCEQDVRDRFEECLQFCRNGNTGQSFTKVEMELGRRVYALACAMLQLFLCCAEAVMNYEELRAGCSPCRVRSPSPRNLTTRFGKVRYFRTYFEHKHKAGGWHPLDAALGITGDGFSSTIILWSAQLATRVSFSCVKNILETILQLSPSTEAIENYVLGLGERARPFVESTANCRDDGDLLVLEVDGKAVPTATEEELHKRRRPKGEGKQKSKCQRHRSRAKRKGKTRKRRRKGDKSKNGRSATLVAMYTLRRGQDGLLHGPVNKKIWASFNSRKEVLEWVREQAVRRGFSPDGPKQIHIVTDGELCLQPNLTELFPNATYALDIRHLEEKIWKAGRTFHSEGSKELE